jgi:hypothetical protein
LVHEEFYMAVAYDASWTLSRRRTVEQAIERLSRMLTRAYISIRAVQRDAEARNNYVTHFNNPTITNLAQVTQVILSMHDRVLAGNQVLTMSYVPTLAAFNALGVGAFPANMIYANIEAFVTQNGVPAATPLTCYIGPGFYTGDVYIPNAVNQRTGTGTILHELSHGTGATTDHAYTWDPVYGQLSAIQRATNADTYRAYCQSFDT